MWAFHSHEKKCFNGRFVHVLYAANFHILDALLRCHIDQFRECHLNLQLCFFDFLFSGMTFSFITSSKYAKLSKISFMLACRFAFHFSLSCKIQKKILLNATLEASFKVMFGKIHSTKMPVKYVMGSNDHHRFEFSRKML